MTENSPPIYRWDQNAQELISPVRDGRMGCCSLVQMRSGAFSELGSAFPLGELLRPETGNSTRISVPSSRRDAMKIAHGFNRGLASVKRSQVPAGTEESVSRPSFAPSGLGAFVLLLPHR